MPTLKKTAELPLPNGKAPAWQVRRTVDLAGAIAVLIVRESGPVELLRRLSDPLWFQAFGCVLGFDCQSSGVTALVCGAVKEAVKKYRGELGLAVCGGKGVIRGKTPDEIRKVCDKSGDPADALVYASKLASKVDNTAVQDGYQLNHHWFFFAPGLSNWCVVQQGVSGKSRHARRYHWLSETMPSFVLEPHAAVACDKKVPVLNLVAREGHPHRRAITALSREHPDRILREVRPLLKESELQLFRGFQREEKSDLPMPRRHTLSEKDLQSTVLKKVLTHTFERQAADFEQLLGDPGVGPQALRSLSFLAEIIYQAPASHRDPAIYSFANGSKEGYPYAVNRRLYEPNLERLRDVLNLAKIGQTEKVEALKALAKFTARL